MRKEQIHMREIVSLNNRWAFSKKATEVPNKMPLLWEKAGADIAMPR